MIQEKYCDYDYSTVVLDLGTWYRTGFDGFRVEMSKLHFAPEIQLRSEDIYYSDPQSVDKNETKKFECYLCISFDASIQFIDIIGIVLCAVF